MRVRGLLLAAGAGRRMGQPKALMRDADGTSWLLRSIAALSPCDRVTVVLGASATDAAQLLPPSVDLVIATDWDHGMGSSLRAGLVSIGASEDAALITLVDLLDVTAAVVARVLAAAKGPESLVRATYDGSPGHPVLIGRDHWAGVSGTAVGDRGARDYLRDAAKDRALTSLECGDLATGRDADTPSPAED